MLNKRSYCRNEWKQSPGQFPADKQEISRKSVPRELQRSIWLETGWSEANLESGLQLFSLTKRAFFGAHVKYRVPLNVPSVQPAHSSSCKLKWEFSFSYFYNSAVGHLIKYLPISHPSVTLKHDAHLLLQFSIHSLNWAVVWLDWEN